MREESHLDDMRSAIRGDFERLAERLGGQELMRSSEDALENVREEPEPEQVIEEATVVDEPESEPELDLSPPTSVDEPELEPAVLPDATPAEEEPSQRSFWDRLLGR